MSPFSSAANEPVGREHPETEARQTALPFDKVAACVDKIHLPRIIIINDVDLPTICQCVGIEG